MPRIANPSGGGVQAVVLALGILEFMAREQRRIGVTEVAREFKTSKSRVHRHLQTLLEAGYVIRDADTEQYRVSARLMALGQAVSDGHELSIAARASMRQLRDQLGHSVALSVPELDGVRIVAVMAGRSNIEIGVKPGSTLAYHASAQGKVALAFGEEALLRGVLGAPVAALTPQTLSDPLALAANLREIRKLGWAAAPNESLVGLNAIAAPIFDALGKFIGSLGLVDSIQFLADPPTPRQIDSVVAASRRISQDLGFRPVRVVPKPLKLSVADGSRARAAASPPRGRRRGV